MEEVECGHCSRDGPDIQVSSPSTPQNTAVNSVSSLSSQRGSPVDSPLSRTSVEDTVPNVTVPTLPPPLVEHPAVDNCPVCQSVPVAPRKLDPCGHVMCELCWVNLFQHDSYDAVCPVCRSHIVQAQMDAALDQLCNNVYGKAEYKRRCDENREQIVRMALEPAAQRPPMELLRREYEDAQANHDMNLKDYEAAQKKIYHLRWAQTIAPIVETLCALLLVALSDGGSRWIICLLITAGWWVHKMEHYLPAQLEALMSIPYPQRRPVMEDRSTRAAHLVQQPIRHHRQATRLRAMPSMEALVASPDQPLMELGGRRSRSTGGGTVIHRMGPH